MVLGTIGADEIRLTMPAPRLALTVFNDDQAIRAPGNQSVFHISRTRAAP